MISIKTIELPISKLLLDPNNPRFAKHKDQIISDEKAETVQDQTFNKMLEGFDVESLASNILKNGYLGFDRLFVKKVGDKYIVVEGNRRAAAVKLLLKEEETGERSKEIPEDVKETFEKLPAIDVSSLSGEEIQRMLGLRHFDSVKDWSALPRSLHLFRAYMEEQLEEKIDQDMEDVADKYLHDQKIVNKISDQYSVKKSGVKKLVQIYRLYLQIVEAEPRATQMEKNLFSMLTESLTTETRKRFEIDPQKAVFSETGLELFIKLVVGEDGDKPILTSVSKGDSALREYKKVLKEGTEEDIARIESGEAESSDVWADVRKRRSQDNIKQIVSRIEKELGQITLKKIDTDELTSADVRVLKQLKTNVDNLLKTLS